MNRSEFQKLADLRAREAGVLLAAKCYDGAYYLAGYAVGCALKACIAKRTRRHDFPPPRSEVEACYTHDLTRLMKVAGLDKDFAAAEAADPVLSDSWDLVREWSEQARYARIARSRAINLIRAVIDAQHGVLPWSKTRW